MSGHDGHYKSKVSETDTERTIRCETCQIVYTVRLDPNAPRVSKGAGR